MQFVKSGQHRNYSIDLLRLISMFMIVVLHINSHGGVLQVASGFQGYILQVIEAFCLVAVNVFVLISGYFLVEQHFKLSKLIFLLLEVYFYSWGINILIALTGQYAYSSTDIISALFPISYREYWFITTYVGMYLLSPVLRWFINGINKWQHQMTILVLVAMTSVWHDAIPKAFPFQVNNGYSLIWFIALFIIAGYIRKYGVRLKRPLLLYVSACTLMFVSWIAMDYLGAQIPLIENLSIRGNFTKYCSVLNILGSVGLFLYFLNRTQSKWIRCIKLLSPLSLGVYLIHDNIRLRGILWNKLLQSPQNTSVLLPQCILVAVLVFFGCLGIDYVRFRLFNVIERMPIWKNIDEKFASYFMKGSKKTDRG